MQLSQVNYRFGTASIAEDDRSGFGLTVTEFFGEEAISRPYWFRLTLYSKDPELKFGDVVNQAARLTIERGGRESYIHGIVASFEQGGHKNQEWYEYRAVLRPRVWTLSLTHRSRVFQNVSVPEIVRTVLEEHNVPHQIELRESYEPREYLVQYNETDLEFISRLLAHEGIRWVFVQGEKRETLHLFDSLGQDPWVEGPTEAPIHDDAGMAPSAPEWISEIFVKEQTVPGKVVLKDYNYREPTADLTSESGDGAAGPGEVYEYGLHFKDRTEGKRLAKVRKEEVGSQRRMVAGRSNLIGFRAGHRFALTNHYREDLNEDYLLVRVRHYGYMPVAAVSGAERGRGPNYRNEFGSAPARVSFRMPRLTLVENFFSETFFNASFESTFSPVFNFRQGDIIIHHNGTDAQHGKFYGLMTAPIIGGGSYAAVDEEGRYKVQMPFDREDAGSRAIRLAQPYGGSGPAGFHFPTHAGNELVFACVDGDPDRPLALGIVPNPDHASPVTSSNSTQHVFRTTSANEFLVDDTKDNEYIRLYTPREMTEFILGLSDVPGAYLKTDGMTTVISEKGNELHTPVDNLLQNDRDTLIRAKQDFIARTDRHTFLKAAQNLSLTSTGASATFHGNSGVVIHAGGSLASAAAVSQVFSTGLGLVGMASGVTQALLGIGSGNLFQKVTGTISAITAVTSEIVGMLTPGVVVSAEGGVSIGAAQTTSIWGSGGASLLGGSGVDILSGAGITIGGLQGVGIAGGLDVGMSAGKDVEIKAKKNVTITALAGIEIKCGGSSIKLTPTAIEVSAPAGIKLKTGTSEVELKPTGVEVKAGQLAGLRASGSGALMLKGMNIDMQAKLENKVTGAFLSLDAKAIAKLKGSLAQVN